MFAILSLALCLFTAARAEPPQNEIADSGGAAAAAQASMSDGKHCGGLAAELLESSAPVRQAALGRAAQLSDEARDSLAVCLARELNPKIQPDARTRMLALDSLRKAARARGRMDEIMSLFFATDDPAEAALAAEVAAPFTAELGDYARKLGAEFASGKLPQRRILAAWLLTKTGVFSRNAEDSVRPLLKDSDLRARAWAAGVMAFMFPEKPDKTSVRDIVSLFRYDEDTAGLALAQLDLEGDKTVSLLRPVLSDPDPELRAVCALVLGGMGEKAKDAVPDLVQMLGSADSRSAYAAAQALGGIGESALEALFACLEGGDRNGPADKCAVALAWAGKPALKRLERGLSGENPENMRRNSALALRLMAEQSLLPQAKMFYADPQSVFAELRRTLPALQKSADSDSSAGVRILSQRAVEAIAKGILPAQ